MDRSEHDLSRKASQRVEASITASEDRSSALLNRSSHNAEAHGPRPHFRVESTPPRSRLSGRTPAYRLRGLRTRVVPASVPRCSVLVASREAEVVAAMVNWIAGPGPELQEIERSTGLEARFKATVAGRTALDRPGSVAFWTDQSPTADYLLTHSDPAPGSGEVEVEQYSLTQGLEWWAGDLRGVAGCYRFRAYHRGDYRVEVQLKVPGTHQVLPALAAVAIATRMDLSCRVIQDRLEEFSGISRGFESRGTFRGATLVDDVALGFGAVGDALGLAREVFGRRTLRAVYSPHELVDPLEAPRASEFERADHLILIDGSPILGDSTRLLAASLRSSGASVACCSSVGKAIGELDRYLEPGDVLITLGAAEVGTIADAFLRRLSSDRHG